MSRNKPRAWSNMKGTLPSDEPTELTPFMQDVFKAKDERAAKTIHELAAEFKDLCEEEEFEALAQADRNIKYAAIEKRVLEELEKIKAMSGTDMFRGEQVTFSPQFTPRPMVKDPEALMTWIRETKQEYLLTLPASRLKSLIVQIYDKDAAALMTPAQRAALQPGQPASMQPPPGVEVFLHEGVHHTIKGAPKSHMRGGEEDD